MNTNDYIQYADYEVLGASIEGFLHGFKDFQLIASLFLQEQHIGTPVGPGGLLIDPDAWYPLEGYLRAFNRISEQVGPELVFELGVHVMQSVHWPPETKTLEQAVALIDVGYHMHHRWRGQVMFDRQTGGMLEGIGHYRATRPPEGLRVVCETPYPCTFDQGLLHGTLLRLGEQGWVVHDHTRPCRQHGGTSCTFLIKPVH